MGTTIKYNGNEHKVLFTSRAIAMIEKQLGKPVSDLGTKTFDDAKNLTGVIYQIQELAIVLKHGLWDVKPSISEEDCFDIIDQNNGCAVTVFTDLMNAYTAIYTIAEAGNSVAQTT